MNVFEKICIIGPTYPFRGGIAHYTTLLYRSLKEKYDVKFYSFKRQYPKWLYPGKTDKDISDLKIMEDCVSYTIDFMNPISWCKTVRLIKKDKPDLLIIPWWVSFWTPQFWYIATQIHKLNSTKVLFICHNLVQHESRLWDRACMKSVLKNGDYFIVHSDQDLNNLKRIFPEAIVKKVFHPTYEIFNLRQLTKIEAQKELGVSGKIMLFFGFVRPYKGLKYLLDAMPLILKKIKVHLLIVGEFWHDKSDYLEQIQKLGISDSVTIVDKYVPNEDVGLYFTAADIVVLPYVTTTHSAVLQIAYTFDKPVIVTNVGGLPDIVEDGKTGFVVEPKNPQAIARIVFSFYNSGIEAEMKKNIILKRHQFSWDKMVEAIEILIASRMEGTL